MAVISTSITITDSVAAFAHQKATKKNKMSKKIFSLHEVGFEPTPEDQCLKLAP